MKPSSLLATSEKARPQQSSFATGQANDAPNRRDTVKSFGSKQSDALQTQISSKIA